MAKILLVEDDNNLREIYEARLQAEGYTIVTAKNGEEALVISKQDRPDLIISDVMMPNISGFEMLDILRNTEGLKNIQVIMLTALGQSENQERAGHLGADRYLVKSQVTLEDIVKVTRELLGDAPATAPVATGASTAATTTGTLIPPPSLPAAPPVSQMPAMTPSEPATPTEPSVSSNDAQIDSAAEELSGESTPELPPVEPMPGPTLEVPVSEVTKPETETLEAAPEPSPATTPETPETPANPPSVAPAEIHSPADSKKIIQPLVREEKKDIMALASAEEAKEKATSGQIIVPVSTPEDLPEPKTEEHPGDIAL